MSTSQQRVLVTGASGFVASYVVSTLLEKGYAVRGFHGGSLVGVSAIIHIALPFPAGTPDEILKSAKHGATNILQQALEKGITKVVITGSWGATMNLKKPPMLVEVEQGCAKTLSNTTQNI